MNYLEDFTEGSEWITLCGVKVTFLFLDMGHPFFTSNEPHDFHISKNGYFGFYKSWKEFKRVEQ